MRMYAACLASYNNGYLHGEWFDLEEFEDAADLQAAIAEKILRTSAYPNVEVSVECHECSGSGRREVNGHDAGACGLCWGQGSRMVPSAEEWAAHDYDGEALSSFGEYPNLAKLLEHVRLVSEHGDAWLAYVSHVGEHYATEEGFVDDHLGECESAQSYFEEKLEESGELNALPEHLRHYFDWESYARDQEISGGYAFVLLNGTTYVFSN